MRMAVHGMARTRRHRELEWARESSFARVRGGQIDGGPVTPFEPTKSLDAGYRQLVPGLGPATQLPLS